MTEKFTIQDLIKKGYSADPSGLWKKNEQKPVKSKKVAKKKPEDVLKAYDKTGFIMYNVSQNNRPIKIDVKPLSVNAAFRGRRFKTPKYTQFEKKVLSMLPDIEMSSPPYRIYLKFGFSSKASDWDNPIKLIIDCLSKRYKFNDKLIRAGNVETEIVPKGKEYFVFQITSL